MAALTPEKFKVIGYTEEDANRIDRPTISYWQAPQKPDRNGISCCARHSACHGHHRTAYQRI